MNTPRKNPILFRIAAFAIAVLVCSLSCPRPASAQGVPLPREIVSGPYRAGHVQGIAVDRRHAVVYISYTTMLVKCDFEGRTLGSVTGLLGHLGCLDFCDDDGMVYGSLEYKDDAIGRGVMQTAHSTRRLATNFYVAVFDGAKITRPDMDAERDGVMRVASLPAVLADYCDSVSLGGRRLPHRFACSGIDGLSFGPKIGGGKGARTMLTVAYGIYGDTARTDNDYQVLLQYSPASIRRHAMPLRLDAPSLGSPVKPKGRYFVHTGNTDWGVQNLEYDSATGLWFLAVYRGKKPAFPNYPMFAFAASAKPEKERLQGVGYQKKKARVIPLAPGGETDARTGIGGWRFPYGSTGIHSLGDGTFYISENFSSKQGQSTRLRLYKYVGGKELFRPM